jgi:uncharacterized protein
MQSSSSGEIGMATIYIDADACPVKDETYRVASRYAIKVFVVANTPMWVPTGALVELIVQKGFGAADDWIAEQIRPGDIAITADVPLAARCVAAQAIVLDPKGRVLDDRTIGEAVAIRDLMTELREAGGKSGGPAPMTPKDRSRFLSELDRLINAARLNRAT